jgi:uncharacterized membrane protein (DUF485 family)
MSSSFTFKPTEAHLLTALKRQYSRFQVKRILWFIAFCAFVGLSISVLSGDTSPNEMTKVMGGMVVYGVVVIMILQIIIRWIWLPRYVRRVFKQQSDLHQDINVEWDDTYFVTRTPNSHVQTPWKDFHLWDRDEHVMLLFRSEALFNFFPIDDNEKSSAADQIEAHLVKAGVKCRS